MSMEDKPLKDSGQRQEFATGAVRDLQDGKGRYDLLPCHAIFRVARTLEKGARKYAERNWEQGIPTGRFMDSALRHLFRHLAGDRDEDHLAQAAWNVLCLIETEHRIKGGMLDASLNTLPGPIDWDDDEIWEIVKEEIAGGSVV